MSTTVPATTGIPTDHESPMWQDGWNPVTETVAVTLCEEAFSRILDPTLWEVENTVLNAWNRLCQEHLPAEQAAIAHQYHRLLENLPVGHSAADLALILALMEGMRGGIDPTLPMEAIFQRVCTAGGIGTPEAALALVLDGMNPHYWEQFRALFPDVTLEIGTGSRVDSKESEEGR
jgi:hypothetical protein